MMNLPTSTAALSSVDFAFTTRGNEYSLLTSEYPLKSSTQERVMIKAKFGMAIISVCFKPRTQHAYHNFAPKGSADTTYMRGDLIFVSEDDVYFIPRKQEHYDLLSEFERCRVPSDHVPKKLELTDL